MDLTINASAVLHHTFVVERTYQASPARVFAAFSDPAQKRRWFAEGNDVDQFEMDFRVGGTERTSSRLGKNTPFPGTVLSSDAVFQDIVPNSRVVCASTMTFGGKRISASLLTFELLPAEKETTLRFTHQAAFFEGADGPQMREAGWKSLLERLSQEISR